ncbi:MAG: hypothetical protein JNL38_35860 [Myxococcales bacterium]|jgi:hypothetical protein|nr:hypothetical protein [Myxococcales bacterium]
MKRWLVLAVAIAAAAGADTAHAGAPRPFVDAERGRFDGSPPRKVTRTIRLKPGEKAAFVVVVAGGRPGRVPPRAAMSLHVNWRTKRGAKMHSGSFPCRAVCGWVFEAPAARDAVASGDYELTIQDDSPEDPQPVFDWLVTVKR